MSNSKFIPKIDEGTYICWVNKVPHSVPMLQGVDFIKSKVVVSGIPPEIISKVLYLTQNN